MEVEEGKVAGKTSSVGRGRLRMVGGVGMGVEGQVVATVPHHSTPAVYHACTACTYLPALFLAQPVYSCQPSIALFSYCFCIPACLPRLHLLLCPSATTCLHHHLHTYTCTCMPAFLLSTTHQPSHTCSMPYCLHLPHHACTHTAPTTLARALPAWPRARFTRGPATVRRLCVPVVATLTPGWPVRHS